MNPRRPHEAAPTRRAPAARTLLVCAAITADVAIILWFPRDVFGYPSDAFAFHLARMALVLGALLLAVRGGIFSAGETGFTFRGFRRSARWALGACIITGVLSALALTVWALMSGADAVADLVRRTAQDQRASSRGEVLSALSVATETLLLVVIAPIYEEGLYRGLLYPLLRERLPAWTAIALNAGWFVVLHAYYYGYGFQPQHLLCGVLCALALERTRSLAAPILIHGAGNLVILVWQITATNAENELVGWLGG